MKGSQSKIVGGLSFAGGLTSWGGSLRGGAHASHGGLVGFVNLTGGIR